MTANRRIFHRLPLVVLALVLAQPLVAQTDPPPVEPTVIATSHDRAMRLTVPVTIDGRGPYQFVVDTGADRTVVSRELADRLGLAAGSGATLHSMSGVGAVSTVIVDTLGLAGRNTQNINAPALSETHLGAQGLLGIDSLKDRRIVMDFRAGTLTIAPTGAREIVEPGTIVVTARSRYGQLVLVDADVDGVPITVIIDSGAQNTIGNTALRKMLGRRQKSLDFVPTDLVDVTGGRPCRRHGVGQPDPHRRHYARQRHYRLCRRASVQALRHRQAPGDAAGNGYAAGVPAGVGRFCHAQSAVPLARGSVNT